MSGASPTGSGGLRAGGRRPGGRRRRATRRAFWLGVVLVLAGYGLRVSPAVTPGREVWPWPMLTGGLLVAVVMVLAWSRSAGSAGRLGRWSRRSRRAEGVASGWSVFRFASGWAMRRKAVVLRPSLAELPWWRRRALDVATPLARVGWWRMWSPCEDVTLGVGGPRTGKTGEIAGRILDARGAVIATSTRTDLITLTSAVRARTGPVLVFNPSGHGDIASTVTFDPLDGCADVTVAKQRADDLLSGVSAPGGSGDREFWDSQARRALGALLHAAALSADPATPDRVDGDGGAAEVDGQRLGMRDVLRWMADPDAAAGEVLPLLRRSAEPSILDDAEQFLSTNDRTRSSIVSTVMPALGWLTHPAATAAAAPGRSLDVEQFLAARGTIYMLGAEESSTAPLVTAFTAHVAREARRLSATMPGERLDPPLTLALDEAALVCTVPLHQWTADMGGRGVTIHIRVQSRAQLRARWGDTGAATILNNAGTLLIFGGTRDADDLQSWSLLAGERDEEVATLDDDGRLTATTTRRVPVLAPAAIANLPAKHALIIRRDLLPAVGTIRMAWTRGDVKAARRAEAWTGRRERAVARWKVVAVRLDRMRATGRALRAEWVEWRAECRAAAQLAAQARADARGRLDPPPVHRQLEQAGPARRP